MNPSVTKMLETYFPERQTRGGHFGDPGERYIREEFRKQAMLKIQALYRAWQRQGDGVLWQAHSTKSEDSADQWPIARAEIRALIGELYAIERLVPGPFPGDASAQTLRPKLGKERSRPILVRIWQWATVQVGLQRSDSGKRCATCCRSACIFCVPSTRQSADLGRLRSLKTCSRQP